MKPTVSILGANGVYARHLTPRLTAAGYTIRALVRRPEAAGVAKACGAEIRIADIFDRESLQTALEGSDICINLATSLPGPSGRGDFAVNDRVRREGVPLLITACRDAGVKKLLQQSICWVGASGETLGDEAAVFQPLDDDIGSRAIKAAQAMEETIRASGLDWVILRGGLFYGPGTGFDADWFSRAAAGKLKLPGDGSGFVTLVHIADMAAATVAALENWHSGQTFIIADDRPVRWRDLLTYVSHVADTEPPLGGGRSGFPSFRMSNKKARDLLGWAPAYADYRAGLIR